MVGFICSHNVKSVKLKCIMSISGIATQECLVGFLQVCNRSSPHIHGLSKEINNLYSYSPTSCKGVHLDSFRWVSRIFQKTIIFCLQLSFQWTLSLRDWNYRSNNLFYNWYCGPQWCECTFWWMFCWLQNLSGGMWVSAPSVSMMCSVLLFRIASSKLQPRATISMHLNWSLYIILHLR